MLSLPAAPARLCQLEALGGMVLSTQAVILNTITRTCSLCPLYCLALHMLHCNNSLIVR